MKSPRSRVGVRLVTLFAGLPLLVVGATVALIRSLDSGSTVVVSFEDDMPTDALATQHITVLEFDPDSGRPTGSPRHLPVKLRKRVDEMSIPLRAALSQERRFRTVTLDYLRYDPASGEDIKYYVVTVTNAFVLSMKTVLPESVGTGADAEPFEEIEFGGDNMEVAFLPNETPGPPNGDGNHNGKVDLRDVAGFQRCFDPTVQAHLLCDLAFDLDDSNVVDLGDLPGFNAAMTGP